MTVKHIVTEDQGDRSVANEVLVEQESLRQPLRAGLCNIAQPYPETRAIAQQLAEALLVIRRRDDENVPNSGQHQNRQRIIDHRLVVDGQ